LYQSGFLGTYVINREKYIQDLLEICEKMKIEIIIPGGEGPQSLLNENRKLFEENNILLAMNSPEVIKLCTDKIKTFDYLSERGVSVPVTKIIDTLDDIEGFSYPCIIKPTKDSGGSAFVSLANDKEDAHIFSEQIMKSGRTPLFQEYIPLAEGEYSFSVLSAPDGEIFGGIGIKKNFDTKLTYTFKSDQGIISGGYSQGLISDFPEIFSQVCEISKVLKSRGPLNIEGRVVNGKFLPFEVNPRFSASTYLWAKAGFNDVDNFIRLMDDTSFDKKPLITEGFCLRSFSEIFISKDQIKGARNI
jgi:carbamoyl-phosphate synthase large subunit